ERIEVIRGPASFLYGTNAMGGVINLVSKRPDTPGMHSRISASTGSYASRNLTLSHGGKFSRLQYMLTAASSRTDGHRPFSQYEGDHFNLHTSYQLSEGSRIEMNGNYADLYLYDPGTVTAPFSDHWYDLVRYGADLSWSHQSQAGDSHLQLHGNFGRHRIYDGFRSHDHTVGVLIYHHAKPWRGATATLGYDWRQYGGEAQNVLKTLDYGEHAVDQSGAYLHLQQLMWRRWLVSAGVRYENPYHQWLPKFGLVWHTMPQLSWRISATKGFRSPTIRELYLFPAPTPDLKPEIMWNYEMGGTYLITANLKLDAAVFRSEGSDLIRQLGQWPNIKLVNSSQFVHSGFELTGEWRLWQNLHTGLSYSWIDVGDQTLNTPGKKWNLFANYQWHRFQVYARVMHVQDLYGADNRQNPLSDYLILDGAVTCRFWDGLSLRLGGKNLNDADYQTMYGYPMPGRTLEAQVRFAF
ncbi:TonB-dependent receptor, partial [candidate division KSB1 bacterium]|nr:TonB-dependent receptor [candidate division KSB1 bacterium]